mmetsp:Transcript_42153/g.70332  ORF Transcript_42153/g.70332 Transcript_42153/m.70332 type:complete len:684 (+) Transcript_42153:200-2251(+)
MSGSIGGESNSIGSNLGNGNGSSAESKSMSTTPVVSLVRLSKREYNEAKGTVSKALVEAIKNADIETCIKELFKYKEWLRNHQPAERILESNWKKGRFIPVNLFRRVLLLLTDPAKHEHFYNQVYKEMVSEYGVDECEKITALIQIKFVLNNVTRSGLDEGVRLLRIALEKKQKIRRRYFELLLSSCVRHNDITTAFDLRSIAHGLPCGLGSREYSFLLELCCCKEDNNSSSNNNNNNNNNNGSADNWNKGMQVVDDIVKNVSVIDERCKEKLKAWCSSSSSTNGGHTVHDDLKANLIGECESGDGKIVIPEFKLDEKQRKRFLAKIVEHQKTLCKKNVKIKVNRAFEVWEQWLMTRMKGDVQVLIDAANAGYYNNRGEFRIQQVDIILRHFMGLGYKCKLVLSQYRANQMAKHRLFIGWRQWNLVYITPKGMNDDAFWMYGAILLATRQKNVFIVSNDLLRDHNLMVNYDPAFFRFMTSHLVRYRVQKGGAASKRRKTGHDSSTPSSLPPPSELLRNVVEIHAGNRLEFHYPFRYSIQPHKITEPETGVLFPYDPENAAQEDRDFFRENLDDDTPAIPSVVQDRVRWMMCTLGSGKVRQQQQQEENGLPSSSQQPSNTTAASSTAIPSTEAKNTAIAGEENRKSMMDGDEKISEEVINESGNGVNAADSNSQTSSRKRKDIR